jgi:dUTP pyrophosphatase
MIEYKLLDERSEPHIGTQGSAGADLKVYMYSRDPSLMRAIGPGETLEIGTGVHVAIPEGWVGLVAPRSSTGSLDIKLKNTLGVIDSDYRGEIKLKLFNFGKTEQVISNFDRIVQLFIVPHYNPSNYKLVKSLSDTARGDGGFGHTGSR